MKRAVFKVVLALTDDQTVDMRKHAEILTVQMQQGNLCVWFECDPNMPKERRRFAVVGIWHVFEDTAMQKYIGTIQIFGGDLIFHVYERSWE